MKRPRIENLQEFAEKYFKSNPPTIKWKKMKYLGLAYVNRNLIQINPNIQVKNFEFGLPGVNVSTSSISKVKLKEGEQYFFILLHEIGHFKKDVKPYRDFISAKTRLERKWPNDSKMQYYDADSCLAMKKSETPIQYDMRLQIFREWLMNGDNIVAHHKLEEWAIKEFKKQRKRIRELLSQ